MHTGWIMAKALDLQNMRELHSEGDCWDEWMEGGMK